jgi:hypothetical protein
MKYETLSKYIDVVCHASLIPLTMILSRNCTVVYAHLSLSISLHYSIPRKIVEAVLPIELCCPGHAD